MQFAGRNSSSSPSSSYLPAPASAPVSWKEPSSSRRSMRSRTVRRPDARWRATRSSPPIRLASSSRRRSSSSSGCQLTGASSSRSEEAAPLAAVGGQFVDHSGLALHQVQGRRSARTARPALAWRIHTRSPTRRALAASPSRGVCTSPAPSRRSRCRPAGRWGWGRRGAIGGAGSQVAAAQRGGHLRRRAANHGQGEHRRRPGRERAVGIEQRGAVQARAPRPVRSPRPRGPCARGCRCLPR